MSGLVVAAAPSLGPMHGHRHKKVDTLKEAIGLQLGGAHGAELAVNRRLAGIFGVNEHLGISRPSLILIPAGGAVYAALMSKPLVYLVELLLMHAHARQVEVTLQAHQLFAPGEALATDAAYSRHKDVEHGVRLKR